MPLNRPANKIKTVPGVMEDLQRGDKRTGQPKCRAMIGPSYTKTHLLEADIDRALFFRAIRLYM